MSDLSKEHLYEGVKLLVESQADKIHLNQPKLYTLMSLGFQYLLYLSTKNPGAYLIRLEESMLADKLNEKIKRSFNSKIFSKTINDKKIKLWLLFILSRLFSPSKLASYPNCSKCKMESCTCSKRNFK
jgi:hypothetical protein